MLRRSRPESVNRTATVAFCVRPLDLSDLECPKVSDCLCNASIKPCQIVTILELATVPLWHEPRCSAGNNHFITEEQPWTIRTRTVQHKPSYSPFWGGAIAGGIAGILFAPKSGEETRRELKGYARKTEEELIEKAKEARAALDDVIERGKHFVTEKRADVEAAVKAGKEAMKEKMEKCCS